MELSPYSIHDVAVHEQLADIGSKFFKNTTHRYLHDAGIIMSDCAFACSWHESAMNLSFQPIDV